MLEVAAGQLRIPLRIPEDELRLELSTSGGPGGQHVNRVQTRVTVCFDVVRSRSLTEAQRQGILTHLASRINKDGILKVRSERHRSQAKNRDAAIQRLGELLEDALRVRTPRRPTRAPSGVKERRLEAKRRRARLKETRRGSEGAEV